MNDLSAIKGTVFNIQKYSLHDGPGIRTIIFLKGCGMRCAWCSNPESHLEHKQLAYDPKKCLTVDACTRCLNRCPGGALSTGADGRIVRDMAACDDCLVCAETCPTHALNVYGYEVTVQDALKRVEEDEVFYARSGGGLTLSGGEPLVQDEFALALLAEARRRHIDTSMETCGHVPWPTLKRAAAELNSVYYDLKCIDPRLHLKGAGVSNDLILNNLVRLRAEFPRMPVTVRTPVVPGFNDRREEIGAVVDFIREMPGVEYELLGYHRMGSPKYGYLGRECPSVKIGALYMEGLDELRAFARARLANAWAGKPAACGS